MGYCQIHCFKDGKIHDTLVYHNPWGGGSRIWSAIYDNFYLRPEVMYDSWLYAFSENERKYNSSKHYHKFATAFRRKDLPRFVRAVHMYMFDYAMVKKNNFSKFSEDLRRFSLVYPAKGVDHLPVWADDIDNIGYIVKENIDAIGFRATSVSNDFWYYYDEKLDEMVSYDFKKRKNHFDIYEALDEIDGGIEKKEDDERNF